MPAGDMRLAIQITAEGRVDQVVRQINQQLKPLGAGLQIVPKHLQEGDKQLGAFGRHFREVRAEAGETVRKIAEIAPPLAGLASALSIAGIGTMLTETSRRGRGLSIAATNLDVSTQALQGFQGGAELAGASAGAMTGSLGELQAKLHGAAWGRDAGAIAVFRQFGIAVRDTGGNIRNVKDVLPEVAAAVARQKDPFVQASIATAMLGARGAELLPYLRLGREGVELYNRELARFGAEMGPAAKAASDQLAQAQTKLGWAVQGVKNSILEAWGPAVAHGTEQLALWLNQVRQSPGEMEKLQTAGLVVAGVFGVTMVSALGKALIAANSLWASPLFKFLASPAGILAGVGVGAAAIKDKLGAPTDLENRLGQREAAREYSRQHRNLWDVLGIANPFTGAAPRPSGATTTAPIPQPIAPPQAGAGPGTLEILRERDRQERPVAAPPPIPVAPLPPPPVPELPPGAMPPEPSSQKPIAPAPAAMPQPVAPRSAITPAPIVTPAAAVPAPNVQVAPAAVPAPIVAPAPNVQVATPPAPAPIVTPAVAPNVQVAAPPVQPPPQKPIRDERGVWVAPNPNANAPARPQLVSPVVPPRPAQPPQAMAPPGPVAPAPIARPAEADLVAAVNRVYDDVHSWLYGDQAPKVRLADDQLNQLLAVSVGGGGSGRSAGVGRSGGAGGFGFPGGGPSEGIGGGYRPPGRFGGMAPDAGGTGGRSGGGATAGVSIGQMKKLALDAGFSEKEAPVIAATLMHESSGNPNARGAAGELGIAQVHPGAWGQDLANQSMGNPRRSMEIARMIYQKQGMQAWSSFNTGRYRQYLDAAQSAKPEDYNPGPAAGRPMPRGGAGPPAGPALTGGGGVGRAVDDMLRLSGYGAADPKVRQFIRNNLGIDPTMGAWCAQFVNAALAQEGVRGTGSGMASSFRNWGQPVRDSRQVQKGDVMVAPPTPGYTGHAGLATGRTRMGQRGLEVEMASSNSEGPGGWQSIAGTRWRNAAEMTIRRANEAVAAAARPTPVAAANTSPAPPPAGRPALPHLPPAMAPIEPGTKVNSAGLPYDLDMTPQERANVETSMRFIRESQRSGKPWYRADAAPPVTPPTPPVRDERGVGVAPNPNAAAPAPQPVAQVPVPAVIDPRQIGPGFGSIMQQWGRMKAEEARREREWTKPEMPREPAPSAAPPAPPAAPRPDLDDVRGGLNRAYYRSPEVQPTASPPIERAADALGNGLRQYVGDGPNLRQQMQERIDRAFAGIAGLYRPPRAEPEVPRQPAATPAAPAPPMRLQVPSVMPRPAVPENPEPAMRQPNAAPRPAIPENPEPSQASAAPDIEGPPAQALSSRHEVEVSFLNAPAGMRTGLRRQNGPADFELRTQHAFSTL